MDPTDDELSQWLPGLYGSAVAGYPDDSDLEDDTPLQFGDNEADEVQAGFPDDEDDEALLNDLLYGGYEPSPHRTGNLTRQLFTEQPIEPDELYPASTSGDQPAGGSFFSGIFHNEGAQTGQPTHLQSSAIGRGQMIKGTRLVMYQKLGISDIKTAEYRFKHDPTFEMAVLNAYRQDLDSRIPGHIRGADRQKKLAIGWYTGDPFYDENKVPGRSAGNTLTAGEYARRAIQKGQFGLDLLAGQAVGLGTQLIGSILNPGARDLAGAQAGLGMLAAKNGQADEQLAAAKEAAGLYQQGGYVDWVKKLPVNLRQTDTTTYNLRGAYAGGLQPELADDGYYHLGSRNPKTGELLKKPTHPTWNKLVEGERKAGYQIYQLNGTYYSLPRGTKLPAGAKPYAYQQGGSTFNQLRTFQSDSPFGYRQATGFKADQLGAAGIQMDPVDPMTSTALEQFGKQGGTNPMGVSYEPNSTTTGIGTPVPASTPTTGSTNVLGSILDTVFGGGNLAAGVGVAATLAQQKQQAKIRQAQWEQLADLPFQHVKTTQQTVGPGKPLYAKSGGLLKKYHFVR